MTRPNRFIHPFGDGSLALNMDDYAIDCSRYPQRRKLEDAIRAQWWERGLVVLVNTGMRHLSELEHWGRLLFGDFNGYQGGAAPRGKWSDVVYSIDDTPPHIDMGYHNEACYLPESPRCLVLGSLDCPRQGGWTLLADNEALTDALLATGIGQRLKHQGVRYVRNMTDKHAANAFHHKHWQDTFQTEHREVAEGYLGEAGWNYRWMDDGSLRTDYWADAFEYNEYLDKSLYFANLGNHGVFFDQWSPFNSLPEQARPHSMLIGDGSAFSDQDIAEIYAINNLASLGLRWQEADVALIDNERWTHARPAYRLGPGERRVMGVTTGMLKSRVGSRL